MNHLWPALAGGARVVVISSSGHHASAIRWNDVQFHSGYDKWRAYGRSKPLMRYSPCTSTNEDEPPVYAPSRCIPA
ncbi:hypothetical protein M8494_24480 [Serratia ureilytica]